MSQFLCSHGYWHDPNINNEPCAECKNNQSQILKQIVQPLPIQENSIAYPKASNYRLNSEVDAINAAILAIQQRMMLEVVDPLHVKIQELEKALKEVTKQFKIEETTDDGVLYLEWTIRSTGVYVGVMPTYYRWMKGEL